MCLEKENKLCKTAINYVVDSHLFQSVSPFKLLHMLPIIHNIVTALIANVFLLMLYSVLEERSTLSVVDVLLHVTGLVLLHVLRYA